MIRSNRFMTARVFTSVMAITVAIILAVIPAAAKKDSTSAKAKPATTAKKSTAKTTSKKSTKAKTKATSVRKSTGSKAKTATKKTTKKTKSPCQGLSKSSCLANKICGWIQPKKKVDKRGRKLTAYCRKVAGIAKKKK